MSLEISSSFYGFKTLLLIIGLQLFGFTVINAASIPSKTPLAIRIQQCREGCSEKFSTKEALCADRPECSTCLDECGKPLPSKLTKTILETWSLRTVSMLQQDSLVLVDVAWDPQLNTPNQCLVTWEVSGGGLMGNLLTETYSVQLSLWPDTKYRVQVTCKNKITGSMSRSLPLNINTSEAITTHLQIKETNKPILQSTIKQQQSKTIITTQSSLMANLPFATSSSSASVPISAPIPTFMDHPLSSFEDDNDDVVEQINEDQQQSNELLSVKQQPYHNINHKHTNYVLDWHRDTTPIKYPDNTISDVQVDKLIPINQNDLNIITIATLSDIQKPLLFGVIAGILLLTFVLAMYICALRSQRVPSDKAALIEDDGCSSLDNHNTNICNSSYSDPLNGITDCNAVNDDIIHSTGTLGLPPTPYSGGITNNYFDSGPSSILNPNFYSKSVHVLNV